VAFTTIVDAATVAAHREDPSWVLVDCRHALADFSRGAALYEEEHLPGAYFANVERDLAGAHNGTNGRHPLPDPEAFAAFLRAIGVNEATQLVAYDSGADIFAARFWFLSRWIGHDACAVLDGGIAAWRAAGLPVTSAASPRRAAGTIAAHVRRELVVDAAYVFAHLHDGAVQLVDARAADRFAGRNETIDPVAGHIPGAKNHPFAANYAPDGRFKSAAELRATLAPLGTSRRIVHQCGSGISAAANLLAMEIAGLADSRLYAGSWSEWIADPARPTATGDA